MRVLLWLRSTQATGFRVEHLKTEGRRLSSILFRFAGHRPNPRCRRKSDVTVQAAAQRHTSKSPLAAHNLVAFDLRVQRGDLDSEHSCGAGLTAIGFVQSRPNKTNFIPLQFVIKV